MFDSMALLTLTVRFSAATATRFHNAVPKPGAVFGDGIGGGSRFGMKASSSKLVVDEVALNGDLELNNELEEEFETAEVREELEAEEAKEETESFRLNSIRFVSSSGTGDFSTGRGGGGTRVIRLISGCRGAEFVLNADDEISTNERCCLRPRGNCGTGGMVLVVAVKVRLR